MKKLLQEILKEKKTVGIAGHVRPDGDCVGSCVGLYLYLTREYPEIKTDVYLEEVPAQFLVLKGTDQVKNQAVDQVYDLFISLDCGSPDRLGFAEEMFRKRKDYAVCGSSHQQSGLCAGKLCGSGCQFHFGTDLPDDRL